MATIQLGQDEEMYGKNEHIIKFLNELNIVNKETIINIEKAIEELNLIGIDIDISIRYDTKIFK